VKTVSDCLRISSGDLENEIQKGTEQSLVVSRWSLAKPKSRQSSVGDKAQNFWTFSRTLIFGVWFSGIAAGIHSRTDELREFADDRRLTTDDS
jgi:hypothetical protein